MWIIFAFGSAFFAGITSILAKCGIRHTDSHVATAIRTIVVFFFSWIMVGIVGSFESIKDISLTTFLFLVLSGLSTGASWLFYFKSLQLGHINKVAAVDKMSVILTIILSLFIFQETINAYKLLGMISMGVGTYLMLEKKDIQNTKKDNRWLIYALLSVVFASLTTILGKLGITSIESNLGTALRTGVVLIMAWVVVFVTHKENTIRNIPKKEYLYICLSGLATGASWLCFYKALQDGPASLVVPIDKLSILFTVLFSYLIFHEKIYRQSFVGLSLIVIGTLVMLL
ncbi:MAG: EamA family transporter [Coprobacillus sp.]